MQNILGLPSSAWSEPIQKGILTATTSCVAFFRKPIENGLRGASYIAERFERPVRLFAGDDHCMFYSVLSSPEFIKVKSLVTSQRNGSSLSMYFQSSESVPRMNDMEVIEFDSQLYHEITAAMDSLKKVADAFSSIYNDTLSVLLSISTDKQLLELLPEAKEFLPPPEPKNSKAVAPAEYVNKLRERIAAGVPDKLCA